VSKKGKRRDLIDVFYRIDRPPSWNKQPLSTDTFPVVLQSDPSELRPLVAALRQAALTSSFVSLTTSIGDTHYQVISHFRTRPNGAAEDDPTLIAFMVNLDWVRDSYFGPLLKQVARIDEGDDASVTLAVTDNLGRLVAASGTGTPSGRAAQRHFPLLFIDPAAVSLSRAQRLKVEEWTLQAWPAERNPGVAVQAATLRLFVLLVLAGCASTVALVLTVRAVRANAVAALMQSDFVTAVTHELKTPVAAIRLVGDTLAQRRYRSTETIEEYALLLSQEAARLGRAIDNMLAFARYTDPQRRQPAVPLSVMDLVDDAIEHFRPVITERGMALTLNVPRELPRIAGDRPALVQVMESIIDNAIKYSADNGVLSIVGQVYESGIRLTFIDHGIGIPTEDLPHVCERFYRGSNVSQRGSGLGLAIAQRVIRYHRGSVVIRSTLSVGTTVELILPVEAKS
jgi:signal transduction histidine kinase